ncbi:hypothetical protein HY086_04560 [Candidatus Gottesmanbacteria bacterium]|nr:hypothetical protein [Candidatus Gottesmanbacteria bacterium]
MNVLQSLTAYPFVQKVEELIKRKPTIFLIVSLTYLVAIGLFKWQIHPPFLGLAYLAGGLLGVYFLDIAEVFFSLTPSPFRTITFQALFVLVSIFVVTSSGSFLATGLVLTMYLTMLLWQVGEWKVSGNLSGWYRAIAAPVPVPIQRSILIAAVVIFLLETALFIR